MIFDFDLKSLFGSVILILFVIVPNTGHHGRNGSASLWRVLLDNAVV